jgi:hypothetical protein
MNNNLDKIDGLLPVRSHANSSFKNTYWDGTFSDFTLFATGPTTGFVIARIEINNLTAATIPPNNAAYNMMSSGNTFIPNGFQPKYKQEGFAGGISGASVGGAIEGIITGQDIGVRAIAQATSFTSTVNSRYFFNLIYDWAGN